MLTKDNIETFKTALSVALRTTREADDELSDRFVELRPGMLSALEAPVNNLITGRRGVGKSTTLAILHRRAEENGAKVIFVDVEHHKSREYPDVLIEILSDILATARPPRFNRKARKARRNTKRLIAILRTLATSAPEITTTTTNGSNRRSESGITLRGGIARQYAQLTAGVGRSRNRYTSTATSSSHTRKKEEILRDLLPAIAETLELDATASGYESILVVLDDYYFVAKDSQPLVLDYLHGATKRNNIWLKIGSVRSRTHTFADGNPPLGMQPPHDLQHLSLDVGLEEFSTAKSFLESVTNGVLEPVGFKIRDVLSGTARERAVLVAGGAVARDYFDLLIAAVDAGWETNQRSKTASDSFIIGAEDVQVAAGLRLQRKMSDLRNDAGREAPELQKRFDDLLRFVRDRETFFFLINRDSLETYWGRQIEELEDLRFVHRIMTTRPNTGSWRGVDTVVFMVDLAAIVEKRMRKAPVEFWKPGKADQLRRAEWIYAPDWTSKAKGSAKAKSRPENISEDQKDPQPELNELPFDDIADER